MGIKSQPAADSDDDKGRSLPMIPTVNFRELQRGKPSTLAIILGVSRSAVSKAIRDGRIAPAGTDGLLDLRASVAAWARNTHPGRIRARALRSVNDELSGLRARIAALEAAAATLRVALASEKSRGRAVPFVLQDARADRIAWFCNAVVAGGLGLAERHTPDRLRDAAQARVLDRLLDRLVSDARLYE